MKLQFKSGDIVEVSDMEDDTGVVAFGTKSVPVASLSSKGEVMEARPRPPHAVGETDTDPSPHYLVRLAEVDGAGKHDVWFTEARLRAVTRRTRH